MPAISTGLAIGLGAASIGGGVASAAIGAHAAGKAADAQSAAAMNAAQLQHQDAQAALDFQKQVYGNQQTELAPWLQTGTASLANLGYLLGLTPQASSPNQPKVVTKAAAPGANLSLAGSMLPGRELPSAGPRLGGSQYNALGAGGNPLALSAGGVKPGYTPPANLGSLVNPNLGGFGSLMQAPQAVVNEQTDPGYQFRLSEGTKALQRSAAARGDLLSGGTAKALERYGQDYASNEYQNVYNRALTEQANKFNRLASLAGVGQTAVGQLGQAGSNAAGNIGNILLTSGNQIGNNLNNAAAARASGYVGGANAIGGAISGGTNNLMQLLLMRQLFGSNNSGSGQLSI